MLMLKITHERITNGLRKQIEELREHYKKKIEELSKYNVELVEQVCELKSKLANAVEGLTAKEKEVLEAKREGLYVYSLYRGEEFIDNVRIPMQVKNYDYEAKKAAGLKGDKMKGVRAVRWVI
jgi:predicted nuclease with TOPRIM domain